MVSCYANQLLLISIFNPLNNLLEDKIIYLICFVNNREACNIPRDTVSNFYLKHSMSIYSHMAMTTAQKAAACAICFYSLLLVEKEVENTVT